MRSWRSAPRPAPACPDRHSPAGAGLPSTARSRVPAGYGIGVRDGLFCADPLTRHLLAHAPVALPRTAVRASLGLGTTTGGVDRLVAALDEIVGCHAGPEVDADGPEVSTGGG
jgi:hypothetical protein